MNDQGWGGAREPQMVQARRKPGGASWGIALGCGCLGLLGVAGVVGVVVLGMGAGVATFAGAASADATLTVETNAPATVYVDGVPRGSTPIVMLPLDPGPHTIRVVDDAGGGEVTRRVTLSAGEARTLHEDLGSTADVEPFRLPGTSPRPPPPPPLPTGPTGTLQINTMPWAEVEIDGQPYGPTPIRVPLSPGSHTVVLTTDEGAREEVTVDVTAGETTRLVRQLRPASPEPAAIPAPSGGPLPATPSRGDVVSAMNAVRGPVSACADGSSGLANVRVVFGSDGRVTSAEVRGGNLPEPVRECIAQAARGATLPPFRNASFSINYPFRL